MHIISIDNYQHQIIWKTIRRWGLREYRPAPRVLLHMCSDLFWIFCVAARATLYSHSIHSPSSTSCASQYSSVNAQRLAVLCSVRRGCVIVLYSDITAYCAGSISGVRSPGWAETLAASRSGKTGAQAGRHAGSAEIRGGLPANPSFHALSAHRWLNKRGGVATDR